MTKKGQSQTIIFILIGLILMVVLVSTAFGKGIVFNALSILAELDPNLLQNELATFSVATMNVPGDAEFGISIKTSHTVQLSPLNFMNVTQSPQTVFYTKIQPYTSFIRYPGIMISQTILNLTDSTTEQKVLVRKSGNQLTIVVRKSS